MFAARVRAVALSYFQRDFIFRSTLLALKTSYIAYKTGRFNVLCIGFNLVFPGHTMYEAWQKLLPGFEWLTLKDFLLGLVESYAYGWYIALVWVPLHNFF